MTLHYDVIIIGAGAAGLMCAAKAGVYGKHVLLMDHANKPGEKIRISGGGRCNFTNIYCGPHNFISENTHFARSALSRYTPQDFIDLVERYNIDWFEKTKGQLFCQGRSQQIIDMLLAECTEVGAELWLGTSVKTIEKTTDGFALITDRLTVTCAGLVIATGGPSIPKMGATGFGYKIAAQFGLNIIKPVPALVPLTFTDGEKETMKTLSGVSVDVSIQNTRARFDEALLFTHRGLSGPAVLQISSYWEPGEDITLDMTPQITDLFAALKTARIGTPRQAPATVLGQYLPARLAQSIGSTCRKTRMADMSDVALRNLALKVQSWRIKPAGSEGYRTAEVTKGGVDTHDLSSKTMAAQAVPGLYFIGEVVDVTGHLGGHNFQWAWASGAACGAAIA